MSDDDIEQNEPPDLFGDEPEDDTSSPRQIETKKRRIARERRETEDFWKLIFASEIGRREMWGIIGVQAHAFNERFACGPNGFPQGEATWFAAGEQALGQRLYQSWFLIDPKGVMLMLQEHDPRFPKPDKA